MRDQALTQRFDDGNAAGHNAVGPQHADAEIRNMHGAALALTVAGPLPVQFRHHAVEVRPLGNTVTVAAVGTDDLVVPVEGCAYTHRYRLLADVAVHYTVDLACLKIVRGALLKAADGLHSAQYI